MTEPNLYHLFVFSGLAFSLGLLTLVIGSKRPAQKTYLFFGCIAFCLGIYYLLFPIVMSNNEHILLGRFAMISFLMALVLFPWYFMYYGELSKRKHPAILSGLMLISIVWYLFSDPYAGILWWDIWAHFALVSTIIYAFRICFQLKKKNQLRKASYLFFALILLSVLLIDNFIFMHIPQYYVWNIPEYILPFDYYFIAFMIIMGIQMVDDISQKLVFERRLKQNESRWNNLLENVKLIVISLDQEGKLVYVNPYFMEISGFELNELIGENWIKKFIPSNHANKVAEVIKGCMDKNEYPHYTNEIIIKGGSIRKIAWSNVCVRNHEDEIFETISIGADVTERENAIVEIEQLKARLETENIILKSELDKTQIESKIIGNSDALKYVLQRSKQVAATESTVLIEGETGVGKELVANFIHENSLRKTRPYVKINCSTIPSELLESELFGHKRGAFTGADKNKKGMFEVADGGTLFLDEIGEFPMELQPKLLRAIQEGEIRSLGSETVTTVDVRIIAATNRELHKKVEENSFRDDLYYRISVYPITVPALRNRKEDIPLLINKFIDFYSKKIGKDIVQVSKTVVDDLMNYDWPGNIRELQNVIERAVIISTSGSIKRKDILLRGTNGKSNEESGSDTLLSLEEMERKHILKALNKSAWKIHGHNGAAQLLDINPNTLRSRIKKLNIEKGNS